MNVEAKHWKINWRKIIPVVIILLIAGYMVGEPYVEKWFGIELPSINGEEQVAERQHPNADQRKDDSFKFDPNMRADQTSAKGRDSGSLRSAHSNDNSANPSGSNSASTATFKLQDLGGDKFKSPEGLIYRRSSHGEHRIDHVMRHAKDDPNRPVHGVFEGDKNQILALIDEAYALAKRGSNRARKETKKDQPYRVTYTIDMQRKIGFKGGRSGQRDRYPPLKKLRLVIDNGDQVITAYPDD